MDLRGIIRGSLRELFFIDENQFLVSRSFLSESSSCAQVKIPKQFDHLKWALNNNQKYYLNDLCHLNPDTISESDIKSASSFLRIPEKNIKSILNTYSAYASVAVHENDFNSSSLAFGNKPMTASEMLTPEELSRTLVRSSRTAYPEKTETTKSYSRTMGNALKKNMVLDKDGHFSSRELYYEELKKSLMMYLFCEINPKDISLNHRGMIQIDQKPIIEEHETFNMENKTFRNVKTLVKDFNRRFECNFRISEHIDLEKSKGVHRTVIDLFGLSSDKLYWDYELTEWVRPGDERYQTLKEKYIQNDGMDAVMPEVPVINHKELLSKYFSGDMISQDLNADWLL